MLSMLRVNKRLHNMIVRGRQVLFLRIVWQLGWMLPACPVDWKSWNATNDPLTSAIGVPKDFVPNAAHENLTPGTLARTCVKDRDWRAYMLIFLRLDNPNIRNRYRLHRMLMQHARG
jgi:hypothetical protein